MALALMFLLNGCADVPIKNETLDFPFGANAGAVEEHTLDDEQKILTVDEWNTKLNSKPMVCMSTDAYGDMKGAYEKLCSFMPSVCTYNTQEAAQSFFSRSESNMRLQNKKFKKGRK